MIKEARKGNVVVGVMIVFLMIVSFLVVAPAVSELKLTVKDIVVENHSTSSNWSENGILKNVTEINNSLYLEENETTGTFTSDLVEGVNMSLRKSWVNATKDSPSDTFNFTLRLYDVNGTLVNQKSVDLDDGYNSYDFSELNGEEIQYHDYKVGFQEPDSALHSVTIEHTNVSDVGFTNFKTFFTIVFFIFVILAIMKSSRRG